MEFTIIMRNFKKVLLHSYRDHINMNYSNNNRNTFFLICMQDIASVFIVRTGQTGISIWYNHRVIGLDRDGVYYKYAKP